MGSSLAGRSNRIVGPLLMTVGLGADSNLAHCAPIPTRGRPLLTLASSSVRRFLHRRHLPAVHAANNSLHPPPRLRRRFSKWPPQRETFEREGGGVPGGAVEQNCRPSSDDGWARGRLQPCTLCTNSHSRPPAAHPRFFFRPTFPSPSPPACRPRRKQFAAPAAAAPPSLLEVAAPTGNF